MFDRLVCPSVVFFTVAAGFTVTSLVFVAVASRQLRTPVPATQT